MVIVDADDQRALAAEHVASPAANVDLPEPESPTMPIIIGRSRRCSTIFTQSLPAGPSFATMTSVTTFFNTPLPSLCKPLGVARLSGRSAGLRLSRPRSCRHYVSSTRGDSRQSASWSELGRETGLEPATTGTTTRCSAN